ncbi:MAG: DUF1573 domain-containing protein [Kiritimatiellae bacterium]|nr:DUF1573 domain-containing protein [Kiritimatiellia bacterium]
MKTSAIFATTCVLLLFGAISAAADPQPEIARTPFLTIPEPLHDFGSVTGLTVRHTFALRNDGPTNVVIQRVRACCGARCTLAVSNIPPGAVSELQVLLDLTGRKGAFRKTLYLHTDDPMRPIIALRLAGTTAVTNAPPR